MRTPKTLKPSKASKVLIVTNRVDRLLSLYDLITSNIDDWNKPDGIDMTDIRTMTTLVNHEFILQPSITKEEEVVLMKFIQTEYDGLLSTWAKVRPMVNGRVDQCMDQGAHIIVRMWCALSECYVGNNTKKRTLLKCMLDKQKKEYERIVNNTF